MTIKLPLPVPPAATESERDFKYFYGCAMIGLYGQFEVPKGNLESGVTPSLSYYQDNEDSDADSSYEIWEERRSKHLAERCTLAAMNALEQLQLFRSTQHF